MSEPGHLVPPARLEANGITADELQRWTAEFERQHRTGRVRLLTPLPLRVRARLWLSGRVNRLGIWLVERDHYGAARALWRIR